MKPRHSNNLCAQDTKTCSFPRRELRETLGVFIGQSTKIINRETGETLYGKIPPYSVVVPGSLPSKNGKGPSLYCAVIVKTVDEKTRSKTSINDLLRD